ncbi:MAG TPA: aromatic ring-hydroxylating dioxygenase subunit alpha [Alphaproteobacteria bacterium]
MYLRNCWYAAAWGTEVGQTPFARTLLEESVMLYRKADGTPVALEDRCCHRNLPLSMGNIQGDNIRCGYHGLLFAPSGKVIGIPGQTTIPPGAQVRSYPVVEKWRWLWIWMGDPAKADPALIPDWYYMDHPDWIVAPGNGGKPLYVKCNYELNNDNVLDLTHVGIVHESRLGGAAIGEFPVKTERRARGVRMSRQMYGVKPPPIFAKYVEADAAGKVDRWQISELDVPTHCLVDVGILPPGQGVPGVVRKGAIDFRALISATPETPSTMHLFYAQTRNFAHDDAKLADIWVNEFRELFMEDVRVMEGQQAVNDRAPHRPLMDINSDSPTIAMRKVLAQHIADEQRLAAAAE